MADLMALFKKTPVQHAANRTADPNDPTNPKNQQGPAGPGGPNASPQNPNVPANNSTAQDFNTVGGPGASSPANPNPSNPEKPLDLYKGLFDNVASGGGNEPPAFSIDPKILSEVSGQLNFASHVTPELVQKLQSGDATAVAEAFNTLGRQVYSTSIAHLSKLTDSFVGARLEHSQKGLGKSVRSELTANSLAKLAEKNPLLKEHMQEIGQKILAKYPDAEPDWIAEQTKKYFVTMATQLDPSLSTNPAGRNSSEPVEEIVWADWLSKDIRAS